jgi:hypothetical protein
MFFEATPSCPGRKHFFRFPPPPACGQPACPGRSPRAEPIAVLPFAAVAALAKRGPAIQPACLEGESPDEPQSQPIPGTFFTFQRAIPSYRHYDIPPRYPCQLQSRTAPAAEPSRTVPKPSGDATASCPGRKRRAPAFAAIRGSPFRLLNGGPSCRIAPQRCNTETSTSALSASLREIVPLRPHRLLIPPSD